MPKTLTEGSAPLSGDAALSALLYLFHCGAMQSRRGGGPTPRVSDGIYRHLRALSQREDLPPLLRETCDELADAWHLAARRDLRDMAGPRP